MISYDGIITLITFTLLGLCSLSRDRGVIVYGYIIALYNIASPYIPDTYGLYYYLSAAFNDLIILKYLYGRRKTKVISALQNTSKIFILINLFGWVAYEVGYKPTGYFLLSCTTYIYILFILTKYGDLRYVGDSRILGGLARFSSNNNKCSSTLLRVKGQVKQ